MVPFLVAIAVLLGAWFRWRLKNRRLLKLAAALPGPPALPLVGNALKFMGQPGKIISVLHDLKIEYGDVFKFWLAKDLNVVVSNPDDIKTLLTNTKTSIKGPQYKYMADLLGEGILSGSGVIWRKHRKIATPNYAKEAIQSYADVFNEEIDLLLEIFRSSSHDIDLDLDNKIVHTTSYIVCRTLLGMTKAESLSLPYFQQIVDGSPSIYRIIFGRMTKWYLQINPLFSLTKYAKLQKTFMSMVLEFSKVIIQYSSSKLATMNIDEKQHLDSEVDSIKNTKLSVIDRFILSKELNSVEMLDETFTIFTSSQEPCAKISSFLLLMMAYHPKCQDRLYNEIKNVIGDQNRLITDNDLKQMPYLDMVFKEVIRLFPIGVMLQRAITEDIKISTCTLPAGCSLVIPIFHIHRDPQYWNNPNDFDPERFTVENTRSRPTNCYIPFSLGPMDCIGRHFAKKLVKSIAVKILQEFHVSATNKYKDLQVEFAISTLSITGFPVLLNSRKKIIENLS